MCQNCIKGMDKRFSHLTATGNATMVDVTDKKPTLRVAVAQAIISLPDEVIALLENDEIHTKKGPVFQTAIVAGIMAAKKTSDLIPLCHPLGLDKCGVNISINDQKQVEVVCTASITGKTGVEMEALTGATVAALTIYDMCKGFSHEIVMSEIKLLKKTGGKRDVDHTR